VGITQKGGIPPFGKGELGRIFGFKKTFSFTTFKIK